MTAPRLNLVYNKPVKPQRPVAQLRHRVNVIWRWQPAVWRHCYGDHQPAFSWAIQYSPSYGFNAMDINNEIKEPPNKQQRQQALRFSACIPIRLQNQHDLRSD